MRIRRALGLVAMMLAVPMTIGGCSALGLGDTITATPGTTTGTPGAVSGAGWIVSTKGSPTPDPGASRGTGTPKPALPPVSFLPIDPNGACGAQWVVDPVLIPMTVTPGAGSLTVTWQRQYRSDYRIAAIPQPLISGNQPAYTWQAVPAASGCTVTATISGLKSGVPYIVWLDAPNSGHERDGSRHPYAGKSGVVYPL